MYKITRTNYIFVVMLIFLCGCSYGNSIASPANAQIVKEKETYELTPTIIPTAV